MSEPNDPVARLRAWYEAALRAGEPDAALLTGTGGREHVVRVAYAGDALVLFASSADPVALALAASRRAVLRFAWVAIGRGVRVEGMAVRAGDVESDELFGMLPREQQLRAWHSGAQHAAAEVEDRFAGQEVPRPRRWGGYRIVPDAIEFRDGGEHVRFRRASPAEPWLPERA